MPTIPEQLVVQEEEETMVCIAFSPFVERDPSDYKHNFF